MKKEIVAAKDDLEDAEDELHPMRATVGTLQMKARALNTLGAVAVKAHRARANGKGGPSDAQLAAHEAAILAVKEVQPCSQAMRQIHKAMAVSQM